MFKNIPCKKVTKNFPWPFLLHVFLYSIEFEHDVLRARDWRNWVGEAAEERASPSSSCSSFASAIQVIPACIQQQDWGLDLAKT